MNNAVKKIIILQSLLLIGCGSQNLVIETYIPKPLVKKYESITANLTFDEEIYFFLQNLLLMHPTILLFGK